MLSPVGEVVQEAVAPARAFVESVVPMSVTSILPMDPRQAIAQLPIGRAPIARAAAPTALATPVAVDDVVPQEEVAEATPTPQSRVIAPLRSGPSVQSPLQPSALEPGPVDQPEIG